MQWIWAEEDSAVEAAVVEEAVEVAVAVVIVMMGSVDLEDSEGAVVDAVVGISFKRNDTSPLPFLVLTFLCLLKVLHRNLIIIYVFSNSAIC